MMMKIKGIKWRVVILSIIFAFLSTACGDASKSSYKSISSRNGGAAGPANVVITAEVSPSIITTGGSTTITATIVDENGANVPDGMDVAFSLEYNLGEITPSATTSNGAAIATFTAGDTPGTTGILVSVGNSEDIISVSIEAADAGSIVFESAEPNVVGIIGSGQAVTSIVTFIVKDINGDNVADGTQVAFIMAGPNGGEYIGIEDDTPNSTTASTVEGTVSVILNSGRVAGNVTIEAKMNDNGKIVSSSSGILSIGGGVPSAKHLNLAASLLNLPGLIRSNEQSTISGYIADRFGNYNVLEGISISFRTEAGAIDRSAATDASGIASVVFRTQAPDPADVEISDNEVFLIDGLYAEDLANDSGLNDKYPSLNLKSDGTTHPRDGWSTILATVQGEETFVDANSNGVYDDGEIFDDLGEPFIDINNNGIRNDGTSDPLEEYIDSNKNDKYDGPNGVWDGPGCSEVDCEENKTIWTDIHLAITGNASYCVPSVSSFEILNGTSKSFSFMLGDTNLNGLVSGTAISVSTDVGKLSGTTSYTVPDMVGGPVEIFFSLSDTDPKVDSAAKSGAITIKVSSDKVVGCDVTISGIVR